MSDAPLKLGVLVGSLRKGSFNAAVARALPELAPAGVAVVPLPSVRDIPLYDYDLQAAEGFPKTVIDLAESIAQVDGVVIVTPEYNYSVPGVLKNAIDWLSRLEDQPFAGKPYAIQSASPGGMGGVRAQHHLRQIMVFLDAVAFNKPEVFITAAHAKINESGELHDETTRKFIAGQLEAFAAFVRKVRD